MTTTTTAAPTERGSRRWCYTVNHYGLGELESLMQRLGASDVVYAVVGKEVGESGTPHLQCFTIFTAARRLAWVKREISSRAHWEVTGGTSEQAADYCKKSVEDGGLGYEEIGVMPQEQGRRSDIIRGADTIASGPGGIQFLAENEPELYVKYASGFEKLASRLSKKRARTTVREPPVVVWLYGPAGGGKTRWCVDREHAEDLWISGPNGHWFDGYEGEPAALLDDFRGDFCTLHWLFRLLDRYPVRVEVKYGHVVWEPKRIYITAPFHPKDVYETQENLGQLLRRITIIYYASGTSLGMLDVTRNVENWPGKKGAPTAVSPFFLPPPEPIRTTQRVVPETP